MNKLKVSACIITYNQELYIRQCLEGAVSQVVDFEYEIIIGDDCSTDNTKHICEEYSIKYPNLIRYIDRKDNLGVIGNWIATISECKGRYIALCEGDDYWTDPHKLQKQVDFLEANPEYVVCYHDCDIVDENNNKTSSSMLNEVYKKDYSQLEMSRGAWMPTLSRCFRNNLNLFPEEMLKITCVDLFLTCLLSQHGKAKYIDICAANYRVHSGGIWNSKDAYDQEKVMINDYKYFCGYFLRTNNKELFDFYFESLKNSFVKILELSSRKKYTYFLESIYINIKSNDRFFNSYFIKLTLKLLYRKIIKSILKRFGFRSNTVLSGISESKKKYLIDNVSIKSSNETLHDIRRTIENRQKGAYMRFGDGDIFLMLGLDDLLHKANKKMAKEMKEAMRFNRGILHKGFPFHSQLLGFENGMVEGMHLVSDHDAVKYLIATHKFFDFKNTYTSFALHYLATFEQELCIDFLNFLRTKSPIFVGNENIKPELVEKLFGNIHIKTPSNNSYLEIDRIEDELTQLLDQKHNHFQVVVVAMGCPGRIFQKRILKKGYNVYLFDFGSLLDALNDDNSRLWIDLAGGAVGLKNILNKLD